MCSKTQSELAEILGNARVQMEKCSKLEIIMTIVRVLLVMGERLQIVRKKTTMNSLEVRVLSVNLREISKKKMR